MKGERIFSIYVPHITLNLLTLFFAITTLRRVNPRYTLAFLYLRMSNRLSYPYRTGYITETGKSYDWGFWVYKSNELNWLYKHHRAKHNKPVGYLTDYTMQALNPIRYTFYLSDFCLHVCVTIHYKNNWNVQFAFLTKLRRRTHTNYFRSGIPLQKYTFHTIKRKYLRTK